MMTETARRSSAPFETSPAEGCLQPLLNALGWTGSLRELSEAMPDGQLVPDMPALLGVLKNLGFHASSYASAGAELNDETLPGLLDRDDGDSWVLIEVEKPRYFKVFKGREGRLATVRADELEGRFYLVRPTAKETADSGRGRFGWFASMLEDEPGLVRTLGGVSLLINCLALALPAYVMVALDLAIGAGSVLALMAVASGMAVIVSTEIVLREVRARLLARFAGRCHGKIMETAFERIMRLPAELIERTSAARLMNRLQSLEAIRGIFGGPLVPGLLDLPFIVLFIAAAFLIGGWLGWLVAGMATALAVLSVALVTRMRPKFLKASLSRQETQFFRTDMIANLPVIQSGNAEDIWERRLNRLVSRELAADAEMQRMAVSETATAKAMMALTGVLIVGFGTHAVIGSQLSIGAFVAVLAIGWRILASFQSMLFNIDGLMQAMDITSQFKRLMRLPQENSRSSAVPYQQISGRIELKNVSYRKWSAAPPILQEISMTADAGELIAVTGPAGADREALLHLIANLHQPSCGSVKVDGYDAAQFDMRQLRQSIALVTEDQQLLPGSLAYNFRLVNPLTDDELMRAAIADADLNSYIRGLNEGLQTDLSDQLDAGLPASVSRKLQLARAYVQAPAIYLFDEPLKDLNKGGRRAFMNKLAELKGRKTIIVGTSDDEMLNLADKVIHLQAGRIVELTVRPANFEDSAARSLRSLLERQQTETLRRLASA